MNVSGSVGLRFGCCRSDAGQAVDAASAQPVAGAFEGENVGDGFADGILTRAAEDPDYPQQALAQARHWAATGEPVSTHNPDTSETTVVSTPTQATHLVEDLQALQRAVRHTDPRSVVAQTDLPRYQVSFWTHDGNRCDEWLLTGCDVSAVIRWARQHVRAGEEVVVNALVPFPPGSRTYHAIRLEGRDPSDPRSTRHPLTHLPSRT